ncbi:LuxR family transcriptional regulator [Nocardioides ultimimeridianus]
MESHDNLVGRSTDAAQAQGLLGGTRLLTLTGPGGVGKTSLARRVRSDVARAFADGAHFVDLDELRDPSLLAATVAAAVGLQLAGGSDAVPALHGYVRGRHLLLVLDNCEHLVDDVAPLVGDLLAEGPGVKILATSRRSLGVPGEQIMDVPPLAVDDAVRLFVERARAAVPDLPVDDAQLHDIARVCERLDGLPLAIELAAARVRVLSPGQIAERLDRGLDLLAGGSRLLPARQQTMRAAIDQSFEQCTELERTVWARASVFVGSFDLDAAEGVCAGDGCEVADVLPALDGLIDKSILVREDRAGRVRFRLLEPLREYGQEVLEQAGLEDATARRHRDWYDELATRADAGWLSADQIAWLHRLDAEYPNLRSALGWSIASSGEPDRSLALAVRLHEYLCMRGDPREARLWIERALATCPPDLPGRARAIATCGFAAVFHADPDLGLLRAADAEALGDPDAAPYIDHVRAFAGLLQLRPEAVRFARSAVESHLARGDERHAMHPMFLLGVLEALSGDPEAGRATLLRMGRQVPPGDVHYLAMARFGQAVVEAWFFGDADAAEGPALEAVRLDAKSSSRLGLAHHLDPVAWVAVRRGQHERAATLFGASARLWESCGSSPEVGLPATHEHFVAETRAALGDRAYDAHHAAGRAMDTGQAVAYALGEADPVPAAELATLTRRESEVAELVAEGLTNREIAERLVIAPRTADTHVQNILLKLGFGNRTQVATWVRGQQGASRP